MKRLFVFLVSIGILLSSSGCIVWNVKEEIHQNKIEPNHTTAETQPDETQPEETEYPVPPELLPLITGFFAEETVQPDVVYVGDETEYAVRIGFTAEANIEFCFSQLIWETETYEVSEIFLTDTLTRGETFVAQVAFPGDMTTYGMTVTDENGSTQHFAVSISGMDGSLICQQYDIP